MNFADASHCRRCSASLSSPAETAPPQGFSQQGAFNAPGAVMNEEATYGMSYPSPDYGPRPIVAPTPRLKTGQATASLVIGVLGIFSAGILGIGSIIGLVLGIRATLKAKREPCVYGGKGVAVGGIVTNSFALITLVPIAIFLAILIPNLMKARMAANEIMAVQVLHDIAAAEATYLSSQSSNSRFGTLPELTAAGLLPPDTAHKHGYLFTVKLRDQSSPGGLGAVAPGFEAVAVPDEYGSSGKNSFFTSEDFVITYADRKGREATRDDKPLADEYGGSGIDEDETPARFNRNPVRSPQRTPQSY